MITLSRTASTRSLVGLAFLTVAAAAGSATPAPPLVDGAWLQGQLGSEGLVILDARPSLRDYLANHIPGAQHVAVDNLRSSAAGVPGELFPPEVVGRVAGRVGIGADSRVVVYAAANDPDAAFVASVLRIHGLGRVSILDGGLARWTVDERPVTKERPRVAMTPPAAVADQTAVVGYDEVKRAVGDGRTVILDVRPKDQFEAGHIPGALSRFWMADLEPESSPRQGLFKSEDTLRKECGEIGVGGDTPVIVYCNTGHMASVVWYGLRYRLGLKKVRLYDGSWVEWSQRASEAADPLEKARAAAAALTRELSLRLLAELSAGGPAHAVRVCSEVAPAVARSHSTAGTSVRRVSLKVRNKGDTPDSWERGKLEEMAAAHARGELPPEISETVSAEAGRVLRYMKPIKIVAPCLTCHGPRDHLDPEVTRLLAERYPDDEAVGYATGDLRGAVSVVVPLGD